MNTDFEALKTFSFLTFVVNSVIALFILLLVIIFVRYLDRKIMHRLKVFLNQMQLINDRLSERLLLDSFFIQLAPLIKTTADEIKEEREECARKWCNMGGTEWRMELELIKPWVLNMTPAAGFANLNEVRPPKQKPTIMVESGDPNYQTLMSIPNAFENLRPPREKSNRMIGMNDPNYQTLAAIPNTFDNLRVPTEKSNRMIGTQDPNYQTLATIPNVFNEPKLQSKKDDKIGSKNVTVTNSSKKSKSSDTELEDNKQTKPTADKGEYENLD